MASLRRKLGNASVGQRSIDTLTNPSPGCFSSAIGAPEYREVENQSTGGRRVRKRSGGPYSLPFQRMESKDLEYQKDPIEDSDDELLQDDPGVKLPGARVMNTTFINKTRQEIRFTDGADPQFFPPHSQQKGHKRKSPPSDDQDELGAADGKPKLQSRPAKRTVPNPTPKVKSPSVKSPSVSQRGAIAPTVWSKPPPEAFFVRLKDAVCLPNYILSEVHPNYSNKGECRLRPSPDGNELRAFRDDNREMGRVSSWLKIGKKINKVVYSDDSEFIKICQAKEANIGQTMVLSCFYKEDARKVIGWMKENLEPAGIKFEVETWQKLHNVFTKARRDIKDNLNRRPNSAHDQDLQVVDRPPEPPRPSLATPRPAVRLRDGMKLSSSNTQERKAADSIECPSSQSSDMPQDSPGRPSSNLKTYSPQARALRSRRPATDFEIVEDESEPIQRLPQRWSEKHADWSKSWRMPLTLRRTTVDVQDIPRLDDGEFLNDNLLNFGLQWLFDNAGKSDPHLPKRVYMFNTFFYTKLKSLGGNYNGVRSWTSRVDLFSYDYIIVPVNEKFHWWLAIICNPRQLDPSFHHKPPSDGPSDKEVRNGDQDEPIKSPQETAATGLGQLSIDEPGEDVTMNDAPTPQTLDTTKQDGPTKPDETTKSPFPKGCSPGDFKIITMDSLESPHSPAVTLLRKYLIEELKDKKKTEARQLPGTVGLKAINIPGQENHCDCGVYVLGYVQHFVKDPDKFVHTLLRKEKPEWWIDASKLRAEWRDTIMIQQNLHQAQVEKLQEEEKQAKLAKTTPPTPAVKKATQLGPISQKVRSSPAVKENPGGSRIEVVLPAVKLPGTFKKTFPASKPRVANKPPARNGEQKPPVMIDLSSPVAKEKAHSMIDLSSPVIKEKSHPMLDLSSPGAKKMSHTRPESGHAAAASPNLSEIEDSPSRQLRESQAAITPTKPAKESQVTSPGTIGRLSSPSGAAKKSPKDDFQEVSPTTIHRKSDFRPLSLPPSSPAELKGRTQRNNESSSPPQPPKDDSFQEVNFTTFHRNSNARHVSHPPSSPVAKTEGRAERNNSSTSPPPPPRSRIMAAPSPPAKPEGRAQRHNSSSSPPQPTRSWAMDAPSSPAAKPEGTTQSSRSTGMLGWLTFRAGNTTPRPPLPARSAPSTTASLTSPYFSNAEFALSLDDEAPVRLSVERRPRAANSNTIDLTDDSMEIVEVREVREQPGDI